MSAYFRPGLPTPYQWRPPARFPEANGEPTSLGRLAEGLPPDDVGFRTANAAPIALSGARENSKRSPSGNGTNSHRIAVTFPDIGRRGRRRNRALVVVALLLRVAASMTPPSRTWRSRDESRRRLRASTVRSRTPLRATGVQRSARRHRIAAAPSPVRRSPARRRSRRRTRSCTRRRGEPAARGRGRRDTIPVDARGALVGADGAAAASAGSSGRGLARSRRRAAWPRLRGSQPPRRRPSRTRPRTCPRSPTDTRMRPGFSRGRARCRGMRGVLRQRRSRMRPSMQRARPSEQSVPPRSKDGPPSRPAVPTAGGIDLSSRHRDRHPRSHAVGPNGNAAIARPAEARERRGTTRRLVDEWIAFNQSLLVGRRCSQPATRKPSAMHGFANRRHCP